MNEVSVFTCWRALLTPVPGAAAERTRSEERRVGKECRSLCDWSSDVCSSDLVRVAVDSLRVDERGERVHMLARVADTRAGCCGRADEIGRASCRERV